MFGININFLQETIFGFSILNVNSLECVSMSNQD